MKLLLLFFVFSINLRAEVVRVPVILEGTKEDKSHRVGENYVYNVIGNLKASTLTSKKYERPASIDQLISTVIFAYKNDDKALFRSLLTLALRSAIDKMPAEAFDARFASFRELEKPVLDFYFEQDNGFLAKLLYQARGTQKFDLMFVVKEGEVYKLGPLAVKAEDLRYHNLSYFLTFREFNFQKPAIVKLPEPKDLSFVAKNKYAYISFLKKDEGKWMKRSFVMSNVMGKYFLDDLDPQDNFIRVVFKEENFAKNEKHEILVVESNFPLTHLPLSYTTKGQIELTLTDGNK